MGRGRTTTDPFPLTKEDSAVRAFRFTKSELAVLEQHAQKQGISINKMAREAIRIYLGMHTLQDQPVSRQEKGLNVT